MSKSKRLMELMMTVNSKRKFTVRELAEEFGVSMRTIMRDLQELSELGIPLYSEVGPHGGYQVLRERILPPIAFSEHEAAAMFFAYQSLQHYSDLPFEAEAESALKKFYHYLPGDVKVKIDAMRDRLVFWTVKRDQQAPFLKTVLDCAIRQQVVRIEYDNRDGADVREILPLGVYSYSGFWYCPAYCFKREAHRSFRVDRILDAEVLEDDSRRLSQEQFSVMEWLQPQQIPGELVDLEVRLTREGVRRCEAEPWLFSQLEVQADGSGFIRTKTLRRDCEFHANYFLGLGTDAHVLGGPEVLERMRVKVAEMAKMYS